MRSTDVLHEGVSCDDDPGAAVLLDLVLFYPDWAGAWQAAFAALVVPSAALIAGLGSWLLVRALARTGVLSAFPSGREQPEV